MHNLCIGRYTGPYGWILLSMFTSLAVGQLLSSGDITYLYLHNIKVSVYLIATTTIIITEKYYNINHRVIATNIGHYYSKHGFLFMVH